MGFAELPRYVPNALEVKASYPSALTIFNAASIISAFVNLAFGDVYKRQAEETAPSEAAEPGETPVTAPTVEDVYKRQSPDGTGQGSDRTDPVPSSAHRCRIW